MCFMVVPRPRSADLVAQLRLDGKYIVGYVGTHGFAQGLEVVAEGELNKLLAEVEA